MNPLIDNMQPMIVSLTDAQAEYACLLGLLYDKYGTLNLKYDEAAAALGISVSTVKRQVERGEIRCVRIGERICIPITEIAIKSMGIT